MKTINLFSKNLRLLLKKNRWTQTELAKKVGLSHVQIGKYLAAKSSPPFEMLDKFARAFGIGVTDLLKSDLAEIVAVPTPSIEEALEVVSNFVHKHRVGTSV